MELIPIKVTETNENGDQVRNDHLGLCGKNSSQGFGKLDVQHPKGRAVAGGDGMVRAGESE